MSIPTYCGVCGRYVDGYILDEGLPDRIEWITCGICADKQAQEHYKEHLEQLKNEGTHETEEYPND